MIEVNGITKGFGPVTALEDVSFTAGDGRITALLGPNGAGKSTCMRILYTVLEPDAGRAAIDGIDVVEHPLRVRRKLGVLPHGAGLYPQLTTRENIAYFGRLYGLKEPALSARVEQLVNRLELGEIADRRAKGFSQGQRTKVALARALVHRPQHLLLDEPTNGLDVMATLSLRGWLRELKSRGQCIVMSTHLMQEVSALCDDVVIMAHGRVVAQGPTEQLRARFGNRSLEEIFVEAVAGS
jgi:sodium transport system ATP-binding protein